MTADMAKLWTCYTDNDNKTVVEARQIGKKDGPYRVELMTHDVPEITDAVNLFLEFSEDARDAVARVILLSKLCRINSFYDGKKFHEGDFWEALEKWDKPIVSNRIPAGSEGVTIFEVWFYDDVCYMSFSKRKKR